MSEDIADLNFGDMFDALAPRVGSRPAIIYGDQTTSWREFDERTNSLARSLINMGLEPDSKVAFYLRNTPAYVELFAACVKARLVHANINYRYVGQELKHVLENSDAEVVVYDADAVAQIDVVKAHLPQVKAYIQVGQVIPAQGVTANAVKTKSIKAEDPGDGNYDFQALCVSQDTSPLDIQRSGSDLYFMYTGGTTGYPKAVMWEHAARIAVIGMSEARSAEEHAQMVAEQAQGPVVLTACPLMHSTGLTSMLAALLAGGAIVLLPSQHFDAGVCLQQIVKHNVERMAIVGDAFSVPMLEYLHENAGDYDLGCVALISSAGAMWSEECKRDLLEYFPNAVLSDSLGSSEGSRLGSSTLRKGERNRTARFEIGPQVKVFKEDFSEVVPGSGEPGLIAKAGPLPLGYYKDPQRTAETFPVVGGERYSMAGDWCTVDKDGTLNLLGRGSNCINSGGEKIYPEEVEEALKTHPLIRDAAVIGVADKRWGQAVSAVLKVVEGASLQQEDIRAHLKPLLAGYKHPKSYWQVNDEIRHANGKMNYRVVQKLVEDLLSQSADPR